MANAVLYNHSTFKLKPQPDLSGALFCIGKAWKKKAGTEGGKAAQT